MLEFGIGWQGCCAEPFDDEVFFVLVQIRHEQFGFGEHGLEVTSDSASTARQIQNRAYRRLIGEKKCLGDDIDGRAPDTEIMLAAACDVFQEHIVMC